MPDWKPSKPIPYKHKPDKYGNPEDFKKPGMSEDEQRAALFGILSMQPAKIAGSAAGLLRGAASKAIPAVEEAGTRAVDVVQQTLREAFGLDDAAAARQAENLRKGMPGSSDEQIAKLIGTSRYERNLPGAGGANDPLADYALKRWPDLQNNAEQLKNVTSVWRAHAGMAGETDAQVLQRLQAGERGSTGFYDATKKAFPEHFPNEPPQQDPQGYAGWESPQETRAFTTSNFQPRTPSLQPAYRWTNAVAPVGAAGAAAATQQHPQQQQWKPSPPIPMPQ